MLWTFDILFCIEHLNDFCKALRMFQTLQTHRVSSTLKRSGSDHLDIFSTSNTRGVFVGNALFFVFSYYKKP